MMNLIKRCVPLVVGVLLSLCFQNQSVHAQNLDYLFNPLQRVAYPEPADFLDEEGRKEFFPDSINPVSIKYYSEYNTLQRHAQIAKYNGEWVHHGPDTIWEWNSYKLFKVKKGVPDGEFVKLKRTTKTDPFELEYSGLYSDGKIQGEVKWTDGSHFQVKNGLLEGPYRYTAYSQTEEGEFEHGYRDGKVELRQKYDTIQLNYKKGILLSVKSSRFLSYDFEWDEKAKTLHITEQSKKGELIRSLDIYGIADCRDFKLPQGISPKTFIYRHKDNRFSGIREVKYYTLDTFSKQEVAWFDSAETRFNDTLYIIGENSRSALVSDSNDIVYHLNGNNQLIQVDRQLERIHRASDCLFGLVDAKGRQVLPIAFEEIICAPEIGIVVKRNGLYGLYDWRGQQVLNEAFEGIRMIYDYKDDFFRRDNEYTFSVSADNRYIVQKEGKWGVVNDKQQWLVPNRYDRIWAVFDGFQVFDNSETFLLKKLGDTYVRLELTADAFFTKKNWVIYSQGKKQGLLSRDFELMTEAKYDKIEIADACFVLGNLTPRYEWEISVLDTLLKTETNYNTKTFPEIFKYQIIIQRADENGDVLYQLLSSDGKLISDKFWNMLSRGNIKSTDTKEYPCIARRGKNYFILSSYSPELGPYEEVSIIRATSTQYFPGKLPDAAILVKTKLGYKVLNLLGEVLLDKDSTGKAIKNANLNYQTLVVESNKLYSYKLVKGKLEGQKIQHYNYSGTGFIQKAGTKYGIFQMAHNAFGVINSNCEVIVPAQYARITFTGSDFILYKKDGSQTVYNPDTTNGLASNYVFRKEGGLGNFIVGTATGKVGVCNAEMKLIVDTHYVSIIQHTRYPASKYYVCQKSNLLFELRLSDGSVVKDSIRGAFVEVVAEKYLLIQTVSKSYELRDFQGKLWMEADRFFEFGFNAPIIGLRNGRYQFFDPVSATKSKMLDGIGKSVNRFSWEGANLVLFDEDLNHSLALDSAAFFNYELKGRDLKLGRLGDSSELLEIKNVDFTRKQAVLNNWQKNLILLKCAQVSQVQNSDIKHFQFFSLNQVLKGKMTELYSNMHTIENRSYLPDINVSAYGESIISFGLMPDYYFMPESDQAFVAFSFIKIGQIPQQIRLTDLFSDMKQFKAKFIYEFGKNLLKGEECSDIDILFEANKDNFFITPGGVNYVVKISYDKTAKVQIPWSSLTGIIKKNQVTELLFKELKKAK
ncbi:MAG: hypothetical protein EP332_13930 [Bacteroidetes bacterium]|nr:MAG: hypothetical protein EP332_13930 [Bacteroidota bacterium]